MTYHYNNRRYIRDFGESPLDKFLQILGLLYASKRRPTRRLPNPSRVVTQNHVACVKKHVFDRMEHPAHGERAYSEENRSVVAEDVGTVRRNARVVHSPTEP